MYISDGGQVASEFQPEFAEPLENLTIAIGRDATFLCSVRGLGKFTNINKPSYSLTIHMY